MSVSSLMVSLVVFGVTLTHTTLLNAKTIWFLQFTVFSREKPNPRFIPVGSTNSVTFSSPPSAQQCLYSRALFHPSQLLLVHIFWVLSLRYQLL